MTDLISILGEPTVLAGGVASALIAIAVYIPKLMNGFKADMVNGNVFERLKELETSDALRVRQIHQSAVRTTKLTIILIRFEAILVANNITIPPDLADELAKLKKDDGDTSG